MGKKAQKNTKKTRKKHEKKAQKKATNTLKINAIQTKKRGKKN